MNARSDRFQTKRFCVGQEAADDLTPEAQGPEFAHQHESYVARIAFSDFTQIAYSDEAVVLAKPDGPMFRYSGLHIRQQEIDNRGCFRWSGVRRAIPEFHHRFVAASGKQIRGIRCS
jgi:hypothetical protein